MQPLRHLLHTLSEKGGRRGGGVGREERRSGEEGGWEGREEGGEWGRDQGRGNEEGGGLSLAIVIRFILLYTARGWSTCSYIVLALQKVFTLGHLSC